MTRFTVELGLGDDVDGELELTVHLVPPVESEIMVELEALLGRFVRAGDRGAFVRAELPPTAARFTVRSRSLKGSGITYICDVAGTDPRFARVLRNALVMFSEVSHPVQSLCVRAKGARGSLPHGIGGPAVDEYYPSVSQRLTFPHEVTPADALRGSRYAVISFARALDDACADKVVAWLEDWSEMAMGGYAASEQSLESGDCAIFDAIPDLRDEATVEMPVSMFGAPDIAWSSLLNLCGRIDAELASVASVTIR